MNADWLLKFLNIVMKHCDWFLKFLALWSPACCIKYLYKLFIALFLKRLI